MNMKESVFPFALTRRVGTMSLYTTSKIISSGIFLSSLVHDRQYILDGMLVLHCFFCDSFQTPIEFDILHY